MAIVKPMALVESLSRKVCEHSNVYFRTNKRTGRTYAAKLCNPYDGEPSEDQTAVRSAFKSACLSAKAILAAKSTDTDTANFNKLQAYTDAYKANRKFAGSLYNFIVKQEYALLSEED